MATITFDTYKFIQKLKDSGLEEKQAQAILETIQEAHAAADLVTKQDMITVLAETKLDIIKWVAGMLLAQSAVIAALVKLL
ncbi:MAG: DUF1640 domain-containing protein [Thermodesulfobacteriota bacterium]